VKQWYKNLLVLTPLLFGDLLFNPDKLFLALDATMVFCAVSGLIYILNDSRDIHRDIHHPVKRKRPLASGEVTIPQALMIALLCLISAIIGQFCLPPLFLVVIGAYVFQNFAYTFWLKNLPIIDVLIIGIGFVLRVLAGCIAIDVLLSPWLFVATFLIAMMLGFSKRRAELELTDILITIVQF
jgi:4-hydroxybenzoate polyprenyltransferase